MARALAVLAIQVKRELRRHLMFWLMLFFSIKLNRTNHKYTFSRNLTAVVDLIIPPFLLMYTHLASRSNGTYTWTELWPISTWRENSLEWYQQVISFSKYSNYLGSKKVYTFSVWERNGSEGSWLSTPRVLNLFESVGISGKLTQGDGCNHKTATKGDRVINTHADTHIHACKYTHRGSSSMRAGRAI